MRTPDPIRRRAHVDEQARPGDAPLTRPRVLGDAAMIARSVGNAAFRETFAIGGGPDGEAVQRGVAAPVRWRSATAVAAKSTSSVPAIARHPRTAAPEAGTAQLGQLDTQLQEFERAASGQGDAILQAGDACIEDLQDAKAFLRRSATNYEHAYHAMEAVLKRADARFEIEETIRETVQDLLLGSVLGIVAPEALLAESVIQHEAEQLAEWAHAATEKGMAFGIGADNRRRAPSESGVEADTPDAKFREAFDKIDEMLGVLPRFGRFGQLAKDAALQAANLSRTAAVGAAGGGGASAERLHEQVEVLRRGMPLIQRLKVQMDERRAQMAHLKEMVTGHGVKSPDAIERELWTNWLASLQTRDQRDAIDNDVIERHLRGKGIIGDFGWWTGDADEDATVAAARRRFLEARGIAIGPRTNVDTVYKREFKREQLTGELVGQTGTPEGGSRLRVGGRVLDCPNAGAVPPGGRLTVTLVRVKPFLMDDALLIDSFDDQSFEVMGVPVPAQGAATEAE